MTNNIKKEFEYAVNYVNNNKNLNISYDAKLNLYKYFKQSTIGNININKPSFFTFDQEPLLKYNAWLSVQNITKENAMIEYINLANKYTLQNNALQNNALQNNALQNNALQNNALQNNALQNNALQNNALLNQLININNNLEKK